MSGPNRSLQLKMSLLSAVATATVAVGYAADQWPERQGPFASIGAADLATLVSRCGGIQPQEDTLELVRKHACSRGRSGTGEILAFEENEWFVYAVAEMPSGRAADGPDRSQQGALLFRRVFLLKPSALVVEDLIRSPGPVGSSRWMLRSTAEPRITGRRFRVREGDTEIAGETLLPVGAALKEVERPARDDRPGGFRVEVIAPEVSNETRFLYVFDVGPNGKSDAAIRSKLAENDGNTELTVAGKEKAFRLTLPAEGAKAGEIEITAADGTALVPSRLLPSGVMPHGPKGAALMERWDAPYRRERLPGWDVGRPCSHLVKAVEDKTFKPGRAIVFGCGSGTNAIYLASKGFEVTGVDVAPSALTVAAQKARQANVEVDWLLADVVALPKLQPYDLIFDRGCYHHICQYDSPGYVEALRRLSHAGTRALILAGSPADGNSGGPPRVKEETIRMDFSTLFDFVWLRDIHFDSRNPDARSSSAWSIHLRRKE